MKERTSAASLVVALILASVVTLGAAADAQAATVNVTNANDSGPGSFRHALSRANSNRGITRVRILDSVHTIFLQGTVYFTGPQDLTIEGNGATLDGTNAGGPAFHVAGGGDLTVVSLTVQNAPGRGIAYEVPGDATGTLRVLLFNVTIRNNGGHGVLVNDQVNPTTPEPPVQPPDAGSDASLDVVVIGSRFINNGNDPVHSVSDNDGLRVNEGGAGDLSITVRLSVAERNGADGIEVDERSYGDIRVDMLLSRLEGNGEFDPEDLDDGFDIDEWNDGSIIGRIISSAAIDNWEEGFDFNENNAGDLRVNMVLVAANGNREEGIDYEEDDDFAGGGDLIVTMSGIQANGNGADGGDGGLKIREKGEGNLDATLSRVEASNNSINGIHIREDALGALNTSIKNASSTANANDGIVFDERSDGDLTASVTSSISSNNVDDGIQAEQGGTGVGTLVLTNVALNGNVGGATSGNVTPTVLP